MADNKTEKPTAQRLRKAREEGKFLSSRGMLTAAQFVIFVWLIGSILPAWFHSLQDNMRGLFLRAFETDLSIQRWTVLLQGLFFHTFAPLLLLGACLLGAALAIHLAVSQFGFSLNKLMPNLSNLNPMGRLSSLPLQNLKSLAESVALLFILGMLLNSLYHDETQLVLRMPFQALTITALQVVSSLDSLLWKAAAIFVVFGGIDLAFQNQRYMKGLKMSKQEIKEEHKRSDGDPQIKMRIRRLRRELLRRRMMKQVPQATAVIVNPTHYAVAIQYDIDSMASPLVTAKGRNWLALRIKQVALESEVPIIENPPLARALYDAAEIGSAISPEFYKAIAEVLAYVYKLMGRKIA